MDVQQIDIGILVLNEVLDPQNVTCLGRDVQIPVVDKRRGAWEKGGVHHWLIKVAL